MTHEQKWTRLGEIDKRLKEIQTEEAEFAHR